MLKVKKPDRCLVYISPLKDCNNEEAKQVASLVEHFMLESVSLQMDFINCRAKQIYDYVEKVMQERESKQ